jgi:hypothetical protein
MRSRRTIDDDAFDERGILRDGRTARITMAMRDSAEQWRGDMHRHLWRDRETEDAMTDIPRRPGFTCDALDRIEEAYQKVEQRDANAWRNLRSHGDADVRGMQQDAQLDAELTLAANIDDPVQRAYAEAEARDKHAWKRPL